MLAIGAVDLLVQAFMALGKAMNNETIISMDQTYTKAKDVLSEKVSNAMNLGGNLPSLDSLKDTQMPAITPDQLALQSATVPTGGEMIDFKSLPQLPTQSSPITVNITLKEAIIEPTSDVFLKRVANTLVPHIQDALNRNNVVMG